METKKTFKNTIAVFLGIVLMSVMLVTAGVYPVPFVDNNKANVAIVYGAGAAQSDISAADSIINNLVGKIIIVEETQRTLSDGITDDEVELGSSISSGKINEVLTDNKIPSLFDGKIDWNDGESSFSYNVHEEILINNIKLETTLDNNDFEGVALTNDQGLEYRYVFDEQIGDLTKVDADPLEVVILGKEYLVEKVSGDTITVTDAQKAYIQEGSSTIINGVTLTVDSVYSDGVFINGINIKEGKKKTINGIEVRIDTIYYRDSDTRPSKVEFYAGGDISKEYSNGEVYPGEDKDNPEWVWNIKDAGEKDGYIGVRYDLRQIDEEDNVVYEKGEYTLPNNFTTIEFNGLNEVSYDNYEVSFDDVDLYNNSGESEKNGVRRDDVNVVVIKGDNDNSFELVDGVETDTLYIENTTYGNISIYYMDLAKDFSTGKPVFYKSINLSNNTITTLATLISDETELQVNLINNGTVLSIGDIEISLGDYTRLGLTKEDAESSDIIVNNKSIGTYENDVMDYYGTVIETPESNADNDMVILKVPSEQVYAKISVLGSEEDSEVIVGPKPTASELNITKVTDGQLITTSGKNIVVVGGSCINTLAAELLGGKFCGTEFTSKTGVNAGQVLIQTFDRGNGNIATLVAGYNAEDTTRGVNQLLSGNLNIIAGQKTII